LSRTVIERIKRKPFVDCMIGILLIAYLGPHFAVMFAAIFAAVAAVGYAVRFAISQTREFTADAGAIELTKNPAALISALRKVSLNDTLPLKGYATRAMMFSSTLESWFSTHPSIEARIAAIMQHGGVAEHEVRDLRVAPRAKSAAPDPHVAFGRKRVMHGLATAAQPHGTMSEARPARAIPATYNTTFGRRAAARVEAGGSPGDRPISVPPIVPRLEETETNWQGTLEQVNAIGAKVIAVPVTLVRYFFACTIAFGLVATLFTHSVPLALAATAFCVWLLFRNLGRLASRIMRA
jgi:Peptidase family M48